MKPDANDRTLASYWSAPVPSGRQEDFSAGAPLACIATTYTFDAALFEVDLLPRFLGLRFDHTERESSFLVERERALGTVRACVLVDHTCVDAKQTMLQWDQMAVRVPGGVQHAKIVVLVWERWLRILVSSANLTRPGYRRNREVAGVLDFFDGKNSLPLDLARDVLSFLNDVASTGWVQAHDAAHERMLSTLELVRTRLGRWQDAPVDFSPRQLPRVSFVGGRPACNGRRLLSVMDQVATSWGTRKATDVAVLTPFVGETGRGTERLVQQLMGMSRRSAGSVRTYLGIPGRRSLEPGSKKMISDLPAFFRDSWNTSWGEIQDGPSIFVVPPARKGETINRTLHAKALSLSDGDRDLVICGSSNFTPHGMGMGTANLEANLCYQDEFHDRSRLDARLPIRWNGEDNSDLCNDVFWPAKVDPLEDESPRQPALPPVFKVVTFNEQAAELTVFFDAAHPLPTFWSVTRPCANASETGPIILDCLQMNTIPAEGYLKVAMPGALRGLRVTCVNVAWTDDTGQRQSGLLAVQTESLDDLLPPELFRGMNSDHIMNCLINGREPEEPGDENGKNPHQISNDGELFRVYDSLREIETTGYTLYQVRKLGQTLAALAERLLQTVRTQAAMAYRLRKDPLGAVALADALGKDLLVEGRSPEETNMRTSQLNFSLAEIALMLAHACRRIRSDRNVGDQDVRPVYRSVIESLLEKTDRGNDNAGRLGSLADYIRAVGIKCDQLVGMGD